MMMSPIELQSLFTQYSMSWYSEAYTDYTAWSVTVSDLAHPAHFIHYLLRERCCR